MKKEHSHSLEIILRYLVLILVAFPNFWVFYLVFTPLTVYLSYFIFQIFFDANILRNIIILNNSVPIELIKSCIAGSAYYLLFVLNMSVPNIKIKRRLLMILFSFSALLIVNVARIVFLGAVFLNGFSIFVLAHKFMWYFVSTAFIVIIWFSEVKIFGIKEIPFYSDIKFFHKHSIFKK
ncbi:pacearchaeosortase [Candidatus Pacearchaeota archaeon]|nr:pacearchaeosortase [Candidatus Pacearchaeota archaeon]